MEQEIIFQVRTHVQGDVNMDGKTIFQGSANDADLIFVNSLLHPENTNMNANFINNQQLPVINIEE